MALTQLLARGNRSGTQTSGERAIPPAFIGRKVIFVLDTTEALHSDVNEIVALSVEVSYDGGSEWSPGGAGAWAGGPFVSKAPDRRLEVTLNRGGAGEDPTHLRGAYAVTVINPDLGSDGVVRFGIQADVV